jgi:hypothetical protein
MRRSWKCGLGVGMTGYERLNAVRLRGTSGWHPAPSLGREDQDPFAAAHES